MVDRKNQHFVPRCALKPFSLNAEGRAINTYLLGAGKAVSNAPLKNQCSKDYFYGEDLELEKALGNMEGHYSRILKTLITGQNLDATDEEWLRLFTVIQSRRTERAIAQLAAVQEAFIQEAFKRHPSQKPPPMTHREIVALSMSAGLKMFECARDLKFIVLRNRTAHEFITSDDPAVLTNKFHFERKSDGGFGIINSGIIMALPLTPKLVAFFFDIGVYTVSISKGTKFVDVTSPADVTALNHLQSIGAHNNLCFLNWESRGTVAQCGANGATRRAAARHEIGTLVRDHTVSGEAYRKGSPDEEKEGSEFLIRGSLVYPRPSAWPGFLKNRRRPITFTNGTAIGYVRKREWLSRAERMGDRLARGVAAPKNGAKASRSAADKAINRPGR